MIRYTSYSALNIGEQGRQYTCESVWWIRTRMNIIYTRSDARKGKRKETVPLRKTGTKKIQPEDDNNKLTRGCFFMFCLALMLLILGSASCGIYLGATFLSSGQSEDRTWSTVNDFCLDCRFLKRASKIAGVIEDESDSYSQDTSNPDRCCIPADKAQNLWDKSLKVNSIFHFSKKPVKNMYDLTFDVSEIVEF